MFTMFFSFTLWQSTKSVASHNFSNMNPQLNQNAGGGGPPNGGSRRQGRPPLPGASFRCAQCSVIYSNRESLSTHITRFHSPHTEYKCNVSTCGRQTAILQDMITHIQSVHADANPDNLPIGLRYDVVTVTPPTGLGREYVKYSRHYETARRLAIDMFQRRFPHLPAHQIDSTLFTQDDLLQHFTDIAAASVPWPTNPVQGGHETQQRGPAASNGDSDQTEAERRAPDA